MDIVRVSRLRAAIAARGQLVLIVFLGAEDSAYQHL
jgi:hypothetical protein